MENSKIEWTDHTFNPWEGCTKVSPGCAHCYAATRNARFGGGTATNWGPGAPRRRTSVQNWKQPLKWNHDSSSGVDEGVLLDKEIRKQRVFCASLADWLDDEVPIEWLADLLDLIRRTPHLDWQLLTKRPANWKSRLDAVLDLLAIPEEDDPAYHLSDWILDWYNEKPPANVWVGTSVEDQQRADERIPELLKIPARVRFLSCEPLLEQVDLTKSAGLALAGLDGKTNIDWVICGGESGQHARPMHPDWARSLRDQCNAAGVPFFFKQWGEWVPVNQSVPDKTVGPSDAFPAAKSTVLQLDGREEFAFPRGAMTCLKIGKVAAGRLLDGREWSEFPA